MNPNTGEIFDTTAKDNLGFNKLQNDSIPVEEREMTEKQKKTKQVSLRDHRSILGRKLTRIRKNRNVGRNDPCICGSGKKYKKCCITKR